MNSKRKGKVACLPKAIRDDLNRRLEDGASYPQIIAWLEKQGHPGFLECNLSRWKDGGHQDWLKAQERLDERQFKHELAHEQARTDDPTYHDAGVYIAQLQFYEALNRLDGATLAKLVLEKPKEFIQLLKTFTHFNRYCLQREKYRSDLNDKQKTERPNNGRPRKSISTEKLEQIRDELDLR